MVSDTGWGYGIGWGATADSDGDAGWGFEPGRNAAGSPATV